MSAALDHGAAEVVAQMQATGTLDDAHKQTLLDALRRYVGSITS